MSAVEKTMAQGQQNKVDTYGLIEEDGSLYVTSKYAHSFRHIFGLLAWNVLA